MAPVYHTCWELTLPLTCSLCDFETKVFIRWRASVARPILFLFLGFFFSFLFFSDFLFSDNAAPATNGRQALFLFSDIAAPATNGRQAIAPPS